MATRHIKDLLESGQAQPEGICLVARTHRELDEYQKYVTFVCPKVHRVEPGKADDASVAGLRLATIHRVKGLEFDHIILVAPMDLGQVSTDNEAAIRARALLYVAATRARHSLFICRLPKVVPHA